MKHRNLFAFLITMILVIGTSCRDDEDVKLIGKWYRVSDFDGLARSEATAFTIGNKGYLTGGSDGRKCLNDLWEYDMEQDFWTQKAAFPGSPRSSAVAFAVGEKGYFGTGYDGKDYYKDFWEYDPQTNTWAQRIDFPGSARNDATAFGLLEKGYIGSGYDGNYLKDFYAYDPRNNQWKQIVSLGGRKRRGATSFVINNVAYVCTGFNNGEYVKDFWKYDPSLQDWIQLRDIVNSSDESYDNSYTSIVRIYGVSFVIGGQAYLTAGGTPDLRTNSWKYTPATDTWEEVAKFKGAPRTATASFSNGNKGFVVTGKSSTYRFDDIWELRPQEYDNDTY
jgi:N-acetylneuraminic acid mutarotase